MPPDRLTIQFLQETADGLRRVTQSTSPVKCLLCSRQALLATCSDPELRKHLDAPGVYLLQGPANVADDAKPRLDDAKPRLDDAKPRLDDAKPRLYVGQADSVADRLDDHLRNKKWWDQCAVLRRSDDSPLNLSQCKFVESRLCDLATKAKQCVLENGNAPRQAHLHPDEAQETEKFLTEARFIVSSIGFNFFQTSFQTLAFAAKKNVLPSLQTAKTESSEAALNLLKTLENHINTTGFPKVQWYWTNSDYRARVVGEEGSRVFLRIKVAKKWITVASKDVARDKLTNDEAIANALPHFKEAYAKALEYLSREQAVL